MEDVKVTLEENEGKLRNVYQNSKEMLQNGATIQQTPKALRT